MTLARLLPDQYGLDLHVQVVTLLTGATHHSEKAQATLAVAEFLVCDSTSQAILKVENDQINRLKENKAVHLINARTTTFNGQLRIMVDAHPKFGGKIEPDVDAPTIANPLNLPNISDTKFTNFYGCAGCVGVAIVVLWDMENFHDLKADSTGLSFSRNSLLMIMAGNRCPVCLQQIHEHASAPACLQCNVCRQWYHSNCAGMTSQQCDLIDSFHCQNCTPDHGPTTYKQPIRKSDRQHTKLNYADMNEGLTGDEKIWEKIINSKDFDADPFKRYRGSDFSIDTIRKNGLEQPVVFQEPHELDMTMPSSNITVRDIADLVGGDQHVDVIDVATQAEQPGWTMNKWADYFHSQDRDRIRNVISLEISGTKFAEQIRRPKIVRDIDWIDHVWPSELKVKEYPKVQLYCLMGTKNSYTDFHIDFGGTSVFYHILSGSKIFFFIPPTHVNLRKYEKWSSSPDQPTIFLGDEVKECYKVHIKPGNTMIIPSGWIHSVFTPEDSIVIGGNFLQGFGIENQLDVYDLEERTNVPQKFRFPYFMRMNWYAAQKYQNLLQENKSVISTHELRGLRKLANYLLSESAFLDSNNSNTEKRRQVRQDIPSSISDPVELVQSLSKQVAELLGPEEQFESEPKQGLKVKLKVKSAPAPRLKLKMKQSKAARRVKKEDDDFIYDDNQYFDEEFDESSLVTEDDDDDYVQDASAAHAGKTKQSTPAKRKKSSTKAYKNDSSDDGLGTGKVKSKRVATKALDNNMADKKAKASSVKQRLLNRIKKK